MTDDKQLFLDFAREIIGWQDPSGIIKNHCAEKFLFNPHEQETYKPPNNAFYPEKLESVLHHVTNWANQNDATFDIHYDGVSYDVTIVINGPGHLSSDWQAASNDLKIALMEACLMAERELAQERVVQP